MSLHNHAPGGPRAHAEDTPGHPLQTLRGCLSFWRSLPRIAQIFTAVSTLDALLVIAFCINQLRADDISCTEIGAGGVKDRPCTELPHVLVGILVASVFFLSLVADAIWHEYALQLWASILLAGVASGRLLFAASEAIARGRNIGVAAAAGVGIAAAFSFTVLLAYLTHMQFGWRIQNRLGIDHRQQGAFFSQRLYFLANKQFTFLKLALQFGIILAAVTITVSQLDLTSGSTPPDSLDQQSVALPRIGRWSSFNTALFVTSVLFALLIGLWVAIAWYAIRCRSTKALLVCNMFGLTLVQMPVMMVVFVYAPMEEARIRRGKESVVVASVLFWTALAAAWWTENRLVAELPAAGELENSYLSPGERFKRLSGRGPEVRALLRGAWLRIAHPSGPSKGRTFFQLSGDGSTLRWSWNKRIIMYYVEEVAPARESLTITLRTSLEGEANLTLQFKDTHAFAVWASGLEAVKDFILAPGDFVPGASGLSAEQPEDMLRALHPPGEWSPAASPMLVSGPIGAATQTLLDVQNSLTLEEDARHQAGDFAPVLQGTSFQDDTHARSLSRERLRSASGHKPYALHQTPSERDDDADNDLDMLPVTFPTAQDGSQAGAHRDFDRDSCGDLRDSLSRHTPTLTPTQSDADAVGGLDGVDMDPVSDWPGLDWRRHPALLQQLSQVESIPNQDLQIGSVLGRGAEGVVYSGWHESTAAAVKVLVRLSEEDALLQMALHACLPRHPNVVTLIGASTLQATRVLVMEFCPRGTLAVLLRHQQRPLDARTVLRLAANIAAGLRALHRRGMPILHRDLKPENIFVGHGNVLKVGDFGMSRLLFRSARRKQHSSSRYASDLDSAVAVQPSRENSGRVASFNASVAAPPRRATPPPTPPVTAEDFHPPQLRNLRGVPSMRQRVSDSQFVPEGDAGSTANLSNMRMQQLSMGRVGTGHYAAPELVDDRLRCGTPPNGAGQDWDLELLLKSDVYSFGAVLWEMLTMRRPAGSLTTWQVMQAWFQHDPSSSVHPKDLALAAVPPPEGVSPAKRDLHAALFDLVARCTAINADKRPSMKEVNETLDRLSVNFRD